MTGLARGIGSAMAVLVLALTAPAGAEENLDQGKTGAQLYASDCAICHKSPHGLNKSGGLFGLQSFLREHYTASRESAGLIAAYLQTVGNAPAPGKHTSKRTAKGEEKAKPDEEKQGKAKSGAAKGEEKVKTGENKPEKAEKSEKSEKTPKPKEAKDADLKTESKTQQKGEQKAEDKSSGTKAVDAQEKDLKAKDAKASKQVKDTNDKKKSDSAASAKPDKKEKSD